MFSNNMDKITIITVVYNAAVELNKTIQSVLSQTYQNIEFIVVDGGSDDGTLDIINNYKDRIAKYVSEPDHGIYDAMNKGIRMSTGKWVNFMNAGDTFFDSDTCRLVLEKSQPQRDSKVIYGDTMLLFPGLGVVKRDYSKYRGADIPFNICHQSSFIDGDTIRSLMYDLSYIISSDANTFYKIFCNGGKFAYIPIPISIYESIEGLSSKNLVMMEKEHNRIKGDTKSKWNEFVFRIKIFIKQFLSGLLPRDIYNRIRFLHIKKLYEQNV